jgi:phosphoribosyl 1,2-cyclic phosphodiesterase/ActR/RegA family two-component response regulator
MTMNTALIINDDRDFRDTVVSWLRQRHWSVLEAADAAAALELSVQQPPQLVLCDLPASRSAGFQFLRDFRRRQNPAAPCLFVATGNGCAADRFQALEAGADEYVGRPVDFGRLAAILSRHAGGAAAPAAGDGPSAPPGARLKFWGVRGSIPTPGSDTAWYGGNTSCVEVRAGEDIIILDSGSGIRPLGQALVAEFRGRPVHLSLLITHTHWDHIQGFPFFLPAYDPKNRLMIYGFEGARQGLQSTLSSQMESPYFPISLQQMPGHISFQEVKGLEFKVGAVPVQAQFLNHPGVCTGYRLKTPGGDISYLPDVELFQRLRSNAEIETALLQPQDRPFTSEHDRKVVEFIRGSEVLILDAQYNAAEYMSHIGWGHSCAEDAVAFALQAKVKRLFLFHHDPDHKDDEISRMVARARDMAANRGSPLLVEAAREGLEVVLLPSGGKS